MSLYIKLSTNFFSHVKTLRLKALIGNDAFWIPPRLWVYAAEHQPDGDISKYSAEEIASLIGYTGDAQGMLLAMLKASFLDPDPLRIHDWEEHNGFHKSFAERASKAAKARWEGVKNEKVGGGEDKRRDEMTQALLQAMPQASVSIAPSIQNGWNPSKFQLRLGALFNRRPTTVWSKEEIKSFKRITEPEETDLLKLEAYYRFKWPENADYRKRDLITLLNNFDAALDRARTWREPTCL